ncbi:MAG TPA: phosphoglycerate mutase, partial [Xanthomonadaceae bacterium]|nr:phosphoglycerate mutase [Xanthomonadaceae bacterium]
TRALDAGDAPLSAWLRADPAYVRPDINGARLLACGDGLQLDRRDAEALLPALRPLFGDAGFLLDAPDPHRWYLRLPREARLPTFAAPVDALGADLFDQLPGADDDTSPEGRRWRALLSEAQVMLHNHPHNAARIAAGRLPVNSLWFWGAGIAPDHVTTRQAAIVGDDTLLRALAAAAGKRIEPSAAAFAAPAEDTLVDLRGHRDAARLFAVWLLPAVEALHRRDVDRLVLDFEDGTRLAIERGHRWRFWRRPMRTFAG